MKKLRLKIEKKENFKNRSISFLYHLEIYLWEKIWLNVTRSFLKFGQFMVEMAIISLKSDFPYILQYPLHAGFSFWKFWWPGQDSPHLGKSVGGKYTLIFGEGKAQFYQFNGYKHLIWPILSFICHENVL